MFTVNAVSTNAGQLSLNFNHAVTLIFSDSDWIELLLFDHCVERLYLWFNGKTFWHSLHTPPGTCHSPCEEHTAVHDGSSYNGHRVGLLLDAILTHTGVTYCHIHPLVHHWENREREQSKESFILCFQLFFSNSELCGFTEGIKKSVFLPVCMTL